MTGLERSDNTRQRLVSNLSRVILPKQYKPLIYLIYMQKAGITEIKLRLTEILSVPNRINLYLVSHNLKPSAVLDVNLGFSRLMTKEKKDKILRFLRYSINKKGIAQKDEESAQMHLEYDSRGMITFADEIIFEKISIATSRSNLERLLTAKTDNEKGIALGYPAEAVESYLQWRKDRRIDGYYMQECVINAVKAGKEIPEWFAYISHVPERFDIVNNDISESSRALGEKYMDYIKRNREPLARAANKWIEEVVQWAKAI
jgi:hypothetical protein